METVKPKMLFSAVFVCAALTACGGGSSGNSASDDAGSGDSATTADTTAPVISLVGSEAVKVKRGATYTDAGATATDDVDGDITSDLVLGGDTVTTYLSGSGESNTYTLTYNVQDNAGNAATEVTRTVRVADYGVKDTGFQNNSSMPVSSGTGDTGKAVIQDSQGNLYVIGSRYQSRIFNGGYGYNNNDVLVLKYKTDGSLDTTFGTNGEFFYDGGETDAEKKEQQIGFAAVMDANGNLYVAAGGNNPRDQKFLVLKIKTDGTLDTSFDSDGVARFSLNAKHVLPQSIALDSNGDILIAAQYDSNQGGLITRFKGSDGSLDTTFGADDGAGGRTGYVLSTVVPYAYAMTIDSNDQILLVGSKFDGANKAVLARFTDQGVLDSTFGTSSGSSEWFPSAYTSTIFMGVLVDDNDNIYASVQAADSSTGNQDVAVVKFAADGKSLDSNFGSGGAAVSPDTLYPRISWLNINSMVMGADGMVYVGGMHKVGAEYNILIFAFNSDGSVADHFGGGGYMTEDIASGQNDRIYGVVVDDTNNRVYATGHFNQSSFYKAFLMRLFN